MSLFEQRRLCVASSCALRPVSLAVVLAAAPWISSMAASLDEVVVSATRTEQRLSDVLADMTVIGHEEIERSGFSDLASILARQPGVQLVRTGGMGSSTSLFMRGANNQHTAVFVDGIRVDSQSTSGGMDWQTIPLASIDRVEILRGPAAAVYGSDAVAGVIQIFTKKGEAGFLPHIAIGFGNQGTRKADAGLSGGQGAWDYAVGVQTERTDGFDAKTTATSNPDKDDYRLHAANAKLGFQLNRGHRLEATALTSQSNSGYDSTLADDRSKRKLETLGLSWAAQWNPLLSSRISVSESNVKYETVTKSPSYTETTLRNYLWQNVFKHGNATLTANLERREDNLQNKDLDVSERERSQNALALGWGYQGSVHSLQLNVRHDDDSEFGGQNTGSAAYGLALSPTWRATASAGTSFRAPTLYQRFHRIYGSASLQPEEGKNAEVGLHWKQGGDSFSMVAYRNRLTNLIEYNSSSKKYQNVAQAELQGITFAAATHWLDVDWTASVDFQTPRNQETGRILDRRAKRYANVSAYKQWLGWMLGAEMQLVSKRSEFDSKNKRYDWAGYGLFNLSASKPLARDFTLTARVDNLMDRDYVLAKDYAAAGRTFYVGLKWMPQ
ncbi:TonB-dependent receptor domain-containing protein [Comamonas sp.]|uniref:TonB-dependent receptor domain-containing protein n=1 Tax=Comamonas sp. TaxID=34028 RepID=UPI002589E169|nr:TonB-dependent receptor [Comamonas sp.]